MLSLFSLKSVGEKEQAGTWPKTAPYLRLKNSKKTSKCQVFSFTVLKIKFFEKKFLEKNYILKKWTEWRAGAR